MFGTNKAKEVARLLVMEESIEEMDNELSKKRYRFNFLTSLIRTYQQTRDHVKEGQTKDESAALQKEITKGANEVAELRNQRNELSTAINKSISDSLRGSDPYEKNEKSKAKVEALKERSEELRVQHSVAVQEAESFRAAGPEKIFGSVSAEPWRWEKYTKRLTELTTRVFQIQDEIRRVEEEIKLVTEKEWRPAASLLSAKECEVFDKLITKAKEAVKTA